MNLDQLNRSPTLAQALRGAAEKWGERTALDFAGEKTSFAAYDRETTRLAHGLSGLGVVKGDRVCSMMNGSTDQVLLWMATCKLGAIAVPINTAFKGEFLRHQIADSDASIIVVDAEYAERMVGIEDGIPSVQRLVVRGEGSPGKTRFTLSDFAELYVDDVSPLAVEIKASDPAMLLYTSGTTGPSKGCIISNNYVCNTGLRMGQYLQLTTEDVYWSPLPYFHMGGCAHIATGLIHGCCTATGVRFSVSQFWPEVERSGATSLMLLSTMINYIADAPDTEVSKRCYGQIRSLNGTPIAPAMQERWKERFGLPYAGPLGYGMTECMPIVTRYIDVPIPPEASGSPHEDFEVKIVDDEDNEVPPNTPGEIVVRPRRAHVMFDGYWRRPEATVEVFRNLWFHTGDIGKICEQGFMYFLDRKKDYLRRGGENISSYEMETVYRGHPAIAEVAVHAVPSADSEDEVKISAILHEGAELTEADLWEWSVERVPKFALPRFIEFRQDFPRNSVGRVLKYELRAEGVTAGTWDKKAAAPRAVA